MTEPTTSAAPSGTVGAVVGLEDCLVEINNALNYCSHYVFLVYL